MQAMVDQYTRANLDLSPESIARTISAGFSAVRTDVENFIQTKVSLWCRNGLWPKVSRALAANVDKNTQQCLLEVS